jgi:hypothetical protein
LAGHIWESAGLGLLAVHAPLPSRPETSWHPRRAHCDRHPRSARSRRFVATEHALADLLAADLTGLDLMVLLVDGIRVVEHTCVVALGIMLDGKGPACLGRGRPRTPR